MPSMDAISRNLMLDSLRDYAKKHIPYDLIRDKDQANEFPAAILKDMYDHSILGVHLLLVPEEHGGVSGGTYDIYRICELLAHIDLGIATSVFATFLGTDPLNVGGTEDQKKKWLQRIAKENLMVAYAATEPDAGSDLINLRTRAEHVLKNGQLAGYRITGNKQWISNGGVADLYTVLAMASGGPCWFLVERDMEGFSPGKHEDKHGIRLSNTASLALDGVYVPKENLIGGVEGQGLLQAQAVFGYTRVMVAAFGLGAGWEAVEQAVRYSQQRIQAGGPLSDKQGYMHKLIVPHAVKLEAARAYIEDVANRLDSGEHGLQTEGAIAKYSASEAGNRAADDAIQAFGGYGYTRDFPVEKIKRDIKITCIYEGTSEVLEMTIYRGRWQEHLKTRGRYYLDIADRMDALHDRNPNTGARAAGLALRTLAAVMEECRLQKLTRHQAVTFKLGRLISVCELAYLFAEASAKEKYSESVRFDTQAWQAMARIFARDAAVQLATEGPALVLGAVENAASMASAADMDQVRAVQKGMMEDMDLVAAKLKQTFKAR
ncbi:MAG TPA: acyl-CoA dehydrogenase family protein [Elusimicrobiales bacterium]|nr:acyl-CoA dehydrogenase family protein [Elusimicrobiales bacterium]